MLIFTDGACSQNGTWNGGWSYCVVSADNELLYSKSGFEKNTTNNRMELTAVVESLKWARKNKVSNFTIVTDSAYISNCFKNKWYKAWKSNGWLTSKKEPVKNRDLWEYVISGCEDLSATVIKTKGHSNDEWNNYVDREAVKASKSGGDN